MSCRQYRSLRRIVGAAALTVCVGLVGVAGALANSPSTVGDCSWPNSRQPFLAWFDPGMYFLAPGGSFEGAIRDWALTGGARQVSGNETYYVNSSADSNSLSLPASSKATSPKVCVSVQSPELRLFLRNTGNRNSTLIVDLNYTDTNGKPERKTVGQLKNGADWTLSPRVFFFKQTPDLLEKNGQTLVSFTFRPSDTKGNWQLDDLYIDPLKSQ
jgi:hypothetical protein